MQGLYDLSIRKKFAVVIVPLVLIIIFFDFFQIKEGYLDYRDSQRMFKAVKIGVEINRVIHEIQKERSITSGLLSGDGVEFSDDLISQRNSTDSVLGHYFREISNVQLKDLMQIHSEDLMYLKSYFENIHEIRQQVDQRMLTADQSIKYFTEINTIALNTVNSIINETRDKDVAQQVHAIIYFLKAKERASIERAIGTKAFSVKHMDTEMYNTYAALVAEQRAYTEAFMIIANKESRDYYERVIQGTDIEEVERLRGILLANETFEEDPNFWHRMITSKINSLKRIENFMSDGMSIYTEELASQAFIQFCLISVIDFTVAGISMFLMTVIVSNLLLNVGILSLFAKKVSSGDLSKKVIVDTKDELGQYAATFNKMVEEINKTHDELKEERDHAEYLYENIYKQSEVVFENVQQGIFLFNKDFKISNLYSKAMEEIFNNDKIAGESFSNFIRPFIIPRELEALEMFMRHLFNSDMDEDVVNQLNPVEQVKIFTEKKGIVTTKYIRILFTRIERNGEIQNVMVTVSDETESILLKQHVEEAEIKKKRETEQVLSILKVDPSVLRGYLHNSSKLLKSISEHYESNKDQDFNKLLNFTFETIHNLKGNSMVIGLELMTDKFHEIEEAIAKLKGKEKIVGNDFLTILYEIDDADGMLTEMGKMLRKVSDIYRKFPQEGQVLSNIMVIDSLEKGLAIMSKETEKPASFKFSNEGNIVIPENYINPFKDIMIQLMRNSMSHSIEDSKIRVALGKLVKGTISVKLDKTEKDELKITYKDDGKGIDLKEIKRKALERNVITELEAQNLTDETTLDLIFRSGFSTSDHVDNYSGRGHGMKLVKRIIDDNGGSYNIDFEKGQYFQMIITLPFTNKNLNEPIS